jgi:hypothetical protein
VEAEAKASGIEKLRIVAGIDLRDWPILTSLPPRIADANEELCMNLTRHPT